MIRIVGIQRDENPDNEFVLLQNQGALRLRLRGHLVLSDSALESGQLTPGAHVFGDDELVPAGMYVMLRTGHGEGKWSRTKEGAMIYHAFMNSDASVWTFTEGSLHLLNTQHTYTERGVRTHHVMR